MCNLYSLTKSQDEIRRAFRIDTDRVGNLPPLPSIFPNTAAPIAHIAEGRRVLSMYRWGMPSPAFALEGRRVDPGVT
jgi:putative SOS response-associated peptidase YedK